jgi:hypothetical protein
VIGRVASFPELSHCTTPRLDFLLITVVFKGLTFLLHTTLEFLLPNLPLDMASNLEDSSNIFASLSHDSEVRPTNASYYYLNRSELLTKKPKETGNGFDNSNYDPSLYVESSVSSVISCILSPFLT